MSRKGFTLIELLVVIAIIGILSTVVLGFIGNARDRARVSAIKQTMGQLRNTIAVLNFPTNGYTPIGLVACLDADGQIATELGFDGSLLGVPSVARLIVDAAHRAGITDDSTEATGCTSDSGDESDVTWAVAIKLPTDSNPTDSNADWWCVDSNSVSKLVKYGNGQDAPIWQRACLSGN